MKIIKCEGKELQNIKESKTKLIDMATDGQKAGKQEMPAEN